MRFRGVLVHGRATDEHLVVKFNISRIMQSRQATTFANEVTGAIQRYNPPVVVVDFSGVQQITSEVLGKLLQIKKFLEGRPDTDEKALRVCGLAGSIERLFKVSHFDRMLPTYAGLEDAIAS